MKKHPQDPPARTASQTQRRPYRYAIALVLACASIISIILLYTDHSISVKDKLTQVGAGLAAAIIFAIIYTILANREYSELIRVEIAEQLAHHLDDSLQQMSRLGGLFLPTNSYPATKDFDLRAIRIRKQSDSIGRARHIKSFGRSSDGNFSSHHDTNALRFTTQMKICVVS
jgi:hypothetical protein